MSLTRPWAGTVDGPAAESLDLIGHEFRQRHKTVEGSGHIEIGWFLGAFKQCHRKERRLTHGFLQLKSHYLFAHHFCRTQRGNEKGMVEWQVKFTRLNFFVPVPQVRAFEELNACLRQHCEEDLQRRLRGQSETKERSLTE